MPAQKKPAATKRAVHEAPLAEAVHQGRHSAAHERPVGPSSNLWVAYRKGDTSFHGDTVGKLMEKFGFTAVALVAVDDPWSALRVKNM